MEHEPLSSLEILASLESLKVAIETHFLNIAEAETSFGDDHADLLKSHIDYIWGPNMQRRQVPSTDKATAIDDLPLQPGLLPEAISRFAPRATINPANNLGSLGTFPREIRDLIYQYALSVDCTAHIGACKCVKENRLTRSGIALLRTSGIIHNEAIFELYNSELFGVHLGYEKQECHDALMKWVHPVFYHYVGVDRKDIKHLPHNAFQLIQNLEVYFVNETLFWEEESGGTFLARDAKFYQAIEEFCQNLNQNDHLHSLDINIYFTCKWADIDYMGHLLEPIKMLRNIRDPSITVYGHQCYKTRDGQYGKYVGEPDPRWDLSEDFRNYLEGLLMSPRGMATYPPDCAEILKDQYNYVNPWAYELDEPSDNDSEGPQKPPRPSGGEEFELDYLRDVYGTDDREALHGGMPQRWQTWLNSEHNEDCEWHYGDRDDVCWASSQVGES